MFFHLENLEGSIDNTSERMSHTFCGKSYQLPSRDDSRFVLKRVFGMLSGVHHKYMSSLLVSVRLDSNLNIVKHYLIVHTFYSSQFGDSTLHMTRNSIITKLLMSC